jgi:hypothetical protein
VDTGAFIQRGRKPRSISSTVERGLPNEIDPKLAKEGEEFLDGVRIDVAPNTPAA